MTAGRKGRSNEAEEGERKWREIAVPLFPSVQLAPADKAEQGHPVQ